MPLEQTIEIDVTAVTSPTARAPRIAVGRMKRSLLVSGHDVLDVGIGQLVKDIHDGCANQAKDSVNSLLFKDLHEDLSTGEFQFPYLHFLGYVSLI